MTYGNIDLTSCHSKQRKLAIIDHLSITSKNKISYFSLPLPKTAITFSSFSLIQFICLNLTNQEVGVYSFKGINLNVLCSSKTGFNQRVNIFVQSYSHVEQVQTHANWFKLRAFLMLKKKKSLII